MKQAWMRKAESAGDRKKSAGLSARYKVILKGHGGGRGKKNLMLERGEMGKERDSPDFKGELKRD